MEAISKNDLTNIMKKYNTNINAKLDSKVDNVLGKTLSTNDYTDQEKSKLANIKEEATKTANSSINGNIIINGEEEEVYSHPSTHPSSMITGLSNVATSGNYNDLLNKPSSLPANGGNADTIGGLHVTDLTRVQGEVSFGGDMTEITTAQFIEILKSIGAFNQYHWVSRGSWSYASNQIINDTGCGKIHLAGCTIEKTGTIGAYTIKISTPSTGSGTLNSDFIYINNGEIYSPTWRKLWNDKNDGSGSGLDADTLDGLHQNDFMRNTSKTYNTYVNNVIEPSQLNWGHGMVELRVPTGQGTPMLSFHSEGATAVGLYEEGCRLYTTGSDGRNQKRLLDIDDYEYLKSSVVNGKQEVVNAINGKLGYASGLTTNHTHSDYAWWINNMISSINFPSNTAPILDTTTFASTLAAYNCSDIYTTFYYDGSTGCRMKIVNNGTGDIYMYASNKLYIIKGGQESFCDVGRITVAFYNPTRSSYSISRYSWGGGYPIQVNRILI